MFAALLVPPFTVLASPVDPRGRSLAMGTEIAPS